MHTSHVSPQIEVVSPLPDDGDVTEGRARVFFRRMFSGGQATNQISAAPPTKSTNQTSVPQTKSTSVPPSKPTNQKVSTVATAARPSPTVNVSKVQSSNPHNIGNNPQAKLLVRPARGGTSNPQKQAPQTLGITSQNPPSKQSSKSAAPHRAPSSTQPQPGVAKWNSNDIVSLKLDSEQLSLTSYTHPRLPPSNHAPSGRGQSMERSGQVDRREVLSRFGKIGKDEVITMSIITADCQGHSIFILIVLLVCSLCIVGVFMDSIDNGIVCLSIDIKVLTHACTSR